MGMGFRLLIRDAREFPLVRLKRVSGGGRAVVVVAGAAAAAFFLFSSSSRATQSHSPESHLLRTICKPFLLNFSRSEFKRRCFHRFWKGVNNFAESQKS